ncbi:MAG: DUF805 domain-containing protein [Sulfobacillus sp.]
MSYYLDAWRHYALFRGRATRPQFWWFYLFNLLISLLLFSLVWLFPHSTGLALLHALYNLAVFLPSIGLAVRRLHDTGRSAWWLALVLVPIAGWIVLWVFYAECGQDGSNAYGAAQQT